MITLKYLNSVQCRGQAVLSPLRPVLVFLPGFETEGTRMSSVQVTLNVFNGRMNYKDTKPYMSAFFQLTC
jgi:hypothetical protein